jgi:NADH-quinone oxidoreductase subunit M
VILAALLLKLGRNGLFRLSLFANFSFCFWLCFWGRIFRTLLCFLQSDGKRLIAFSSICHINIVVLPINISLLLGKRAAIIIIVAHGVIRALIFFLFGSIFQSVLSRKIYYFKKIWRVILIGAVRAILLSNFGVPPFFRRVREIFLLTTTYLVIKSSLWGILIYVVLCGYFRLFLLGVILLGKTSSIGKTTPTIIITLVLGGGRRLFLLLFLFL